MPAPVLGSSKCPSKIELNDRVLLLLDIQQCVLAPTSKGGIPGAQPVRDNIGEILTAARKAERPPLIVHVRNTGDVGDMDEPDTPGWQLIFPPLPSEIVVDKRKNNAFAGTDLADYIPNNAEITMVGFQTDFSIRATCSAALGRGNEVLLVRGAHKTYPRIEVLHGGGVTEAEKVEAEIEAELSEAGAHMLEMEDIGGIFNGR
ncbi:Isochorismatase hydrolase [Macrolepiota fuliginosa MF-IS2]|uniref:Isochorismatase hydrolase n=1 Tax=Macrolepiota fuliginosa MF-IS2 TaxID=1400762 RepID=A0A9P5XBT6_9AGAR|nr:Isochorismatase hydrolase [Macrolepiota fuliginosa MF-IS2]